MSLTATTPAYYKSRLQEQLVKLKGGGQTTETAALSVLKLVQQTLQQGIDQQSNAATVSKAIAGSAGEASLLKRWPAVTLEAADACLALSHSSLAALLYDEVRRFLTSPAGQHAAQEPASKNGSKRSLAQQTATIIRCLQGAATANAAQAASSSSLTTDAHKLDKTCAALDGLHVSLRMAMELPQQDRDDQVQWIYSGTVLTAAISERLLSYNSPAAGTRVLPILSYALLCLESVPALCSTRYLPWRVQLYGSLCRAFDSLGVLSTPHAGEASGGGDDQAAHMMLSKGPVAAIRNNVKAASHACDRAIRVIAAIRHLLLSDPPTLEASVAVLDHCRAEMVLRKFRYDSCLAVDKDASSTPSSSSSALEAALQSLTKTLPQASARIVAIVNALAWAHRGRRRIILHSPPGSEATGLLMDAALGSVEANTTSSSTDNQAAKPAAEGGAQPTVIPDAATIEKVQAAEAGRVKFLLSSLFALLKPFFDAPSNAGLSLVHAHACYEKLRQADCVCAALDEERGCASLGAGGSGSGVGLGAASSVASALRVRGRYRRLLQQQHHNQQQAAGSAPAPAEGRAASGLSFALQTTSIPAEGTSHTTKVPLGGFQKPFTSVAVQPLLESWKALMTSKVTLPTGGNGVTLADLLPLPLHASLLRLLLSYESFAEFDFLLHLLEARCTAALVHLQQQQEQEQEKASHGHAGQNSPSTASSSSSAAAAHSLLTDSLLPAWQLRDMLLEALLMRRARELELATATTSTSISTSTSTFMRVPRTPPSSLSSLASTASAAAAAAVPGSAKPPSAGPGGKPGSAAVTAASAAPSAGAAGKAAAPASAAAAKGAKPGSAAVTGPAAGGDAAGAAGSADAASAAAGSSSSSSSSPASPLPIPIPFSLSPGALFLLPESAGAAAALASTAADQFEAEPAQAASSSSSSSSSPLLLPIVRVDPLVIEGLCNAMLACLAPASSNNGKKSSSGIHNNSKSAIDTLTSAASLEDQGSDEQANRFLSPSSSRVDLLRDAFTLLYECSRALLAWQESRPVAEAVLGSSALGQAVSDVLLLSYRTLNAVAAAKILVSPAPNSPLPAGFDGNAHAAAASSSATSTSTAPPEVVSVIQEAALKGEVALRYATLCMARNCYLPLAIQAIRAGLVSVQEERDKFVAAETRLPLPLPASSKASADGASAAAMAILSLSQDAVSIARSPHDPSAFSSPHSHQRQAALACLHADLLSMWFAAEFRLAAFRSQEASVAATCRAASEAYTRQQQAKKAAMHKKALALAEQKAEQTLAKAAGNGAVGEDDLLFGSTDRTATSGRGGSSALAITAGGARSRHAAIAAAVFGESALMAGERAFKKHLAQYYNNEEGLEDEGEQGSGDGREEEGSRRSFGKSTAAPACALFGSLTVPGAGPLMLSSSSVGPLPHTLSSSSRQLTASRKQIVTGPIPPAAAFAAAVGRLQGDEEDEEDDGGGNQDIRLQALADAGSSSPALAVARPSSAGSLGGASSSSSSSAAGGSSGEASPSVATTRQPVKGGDKSGGSGSGGATAEEDYQTVYAKAVAQAIRTPRGRGGGGGGGGSSSSSFAGFGPDGATVKRLLASCGKNHAWKSLLYLALIPYAGTVGVDVKEGNAGAGPSDSSSGSSTIASVDTLVAQAFKALKSAEKQEIALAKAMLVPTSEQTAAIIRHQGASASSSSSSKPSVTDENEGSSSATNGSAATRKTSLAKTALALANGTSAGSGTASALIPDSVKASLKKVAAAASSSGVANGKSEALVTTAAASSSDSLPPPPTIISRSSSFISVLLPPSSTIHSGHPVLYGKTFGTGTSVAPTSTSSLQGTGVPCELFASQTYLPTLCYVSATALVPNEIYHFAVGVVKPQPHQQQQQQPLGLIEADDIHNARRLQGGGVSVSTRPVLAATPLPLFYLWAMFASEAARRGLVHPFAAFAASKVAREFISVAPTRAKLSPSPGTGPYPPLKTYSLRTDRLIRAPRPLVQGLIKCLLLCGEFSDHDAGLLSATTTSSSNGSSSSSYPELASLAVMQPHGHSVPTAAAVARLLTGAPPPPPPTVTVARVDAHAATEPTVATRLIEADSSVADEDGWPRDAGNAGSSSNSGNGRIADGFASKDEAALATMPSSSWSSGPAGVLSRALSRVSCYVAACEVSCAMMDPFLMQSAAISLYYALAPLLAALRGAAPSHPDLFVHPLTVAYTTLSALPSHFARSAKAEAVRGKALYHLVRGGAMAMASSSSASSHHDNASTAGGGFTAARDAFLARLLSLHSSAVASSTPGAAATPRALAISTPFVSSWLNRLGEGAGAGASGVDESSSAFKPLRDYSPWLTETGALLASFVPPFVQSSALRLFAGAHGGLLPLPALTDGSSTEASSSSSATAAAVDPSYGRHMASLFHSLVWSPRFLEMLSAQAAALALQRKTLAAVSADGPIADETSASSTAEGGVSSASAASNEDVPLIAFVKGALKFLQIPGPAGAAASSTAPAAAAPAAGAAAPATAKGTAKADPKAAAPAPAAAATTTASAVAGPSGTPADASTMATTASQAPELVRAFLQTFGFPSPAPASSSSSATATASSPASLTSAEAEAVAAIDAKLGKEQHQEMLLSAQLFLVFRTHGFASAISFLLTKQVLAAGGASTAGATDGSTAAGRVASAAAGGKGAPAAAPAAAGKGGKPDPKAAAAAPAPAAAPAAASDASSASPAEVLLSLSRHFPRLATRLLSVGLALSPALFNGMGSPSTVGGAESSSVAAQTLMQGLFPAISASMSQLVAAVKQIGSSAAVTTTTTTTAGKDSKAASAAAAAAAALAPLVKAVMAAAAVEDPFGGLLTALLLSASSSSSEDSAGLVGPLASLVAKGPSSASGDGGSTGTGAAALTAASGNGGEVLMALSASLLRPLVALALCLSSFPATVPPSPEEAAQAASAAAFAAHGFTPEGTPLNAAPAAPAPVAAAPAPAPAPAKGGKPDPKAAAAAPAPAPAPAPAAAPAANAANDAALATAKAAAALASEAARDKAKLALRAYRNQHQRATQSLLYVCRALLLAKCLDSESPAMDPLEDIVEFETSLRGAISDASHSYSFPHNNGSSATPLYLTAFIPIPAKKAGFALDGPNAAAGASSSNLETGFSSSPVRAPAGSKAALAAAASSSSEELSSLPGGGSGTNLNQAGLAVTALASSPGLQELMALVSESNNGNGGASSGEEAFAIHSAVARGGGGGNASSSPPQLAWSMLRAGDLANEEEAGGLPQQAREALAVLSHSDLCRARALLCRLVAVAQAAFSLENRTHAAPDAAAPPAANSGSVGLGSAIVPVDGNKEWRSKPGSSSSYFEGLGPLATGEHLVALLEPVDINNNSSSGNSAGGTGGQPASSSSQPQVAASALQPRPSVPISQYRVVPMPLASVAIDTATSNTTQGAPAPSAAVVSSPHALFRLVLEACSDAAVLGRGAAAWNSVLHAGKTAWAAVGASWAAPHLFGPSSLPHPPQEQALSRGHPSSTGETAETKQEDATVPVPSAAVSSLPPNVPLSLPSCIDEVDLSWSLIRPMPVKESLLPGTEKQATLDWRPLWRICLALMDLVSAAAVGRNESRFGDGLAPGQLVLAKASVTAAATADQEALHRARLAPDDAGVTSRMMTARGGGRVSALSLRRQQQGAADDSVSVGTGVGGGGGGNNATATGRLAELVDDDAGAGDEDLNNMDGDGGDDDLNNNDDFGDEEGFGGDDGAGGAGGGPDDALFGKVAPAFSGSSNAAASGLSFLPPQVNKDDIAWICRLINYCSQALLHAQEWDMLARFGLRVRKCYPLAIHLLGGPDAVSQSPDPSTPELGWSGVGGSPAGAGADGSSFSAVAQALQQAQIIASSSSGGDGGDGGSSSLEPSDAVVAAQFFATSRSQSLLSSFTAPSRSTSPAAAEHSLYLALKLGVYAARVRWTEGKSYLLAARSHLKDNRRSFLTRPSLSPEAKRRAGDAMLYNAMLQEQERYWVRVSAALKARINRFSAIEKNRRRVLRVLERAIERRYYEATLHRRGFLSARTVAIRHAVYGGEGDLFDEKDKAGRTTSGENALLRRVLPSSTFSVLPSLTQSCVTIIVPPPSALPAPATGGAQGAAAATGTGGLGVSAVRGLRAAAAAAATTTTTTTTTTTAATKSTAIVPASPSAGGSSKAMATPPHLVGAPRWRLLAEPLALPRVPIFLAGGTGSDAASSSSAFAPVASILSFPGASFEEVVQALSGVISKLRERRETAMLVQALGMLASLQTSRAIKALSGSSNGQEGVDGDAGSAHAYLRRAIKTHKEALDACFGTMDVIKSSSNWKTAMASIGAAASRHEQEQAKLAAAAAEDDDEDEEGAEDESEDLQQSPAFAASALRLQAKKEVQRAQRLAKASEKAAAAFSSSSSSSHGHGGSGNKGEGSALPLPPEVAAASSAFSALIRYQGVAGLLVPVVVSQRLISLAQAASAVSDYGNGGSEGDWDGGKTGTGATAATATLRGTATTSGLGGTAAAAAASSSSGVALSPLLPQKQILQLHLLSAACIKATFTLSQGLHHPATSIAFSRHRPGVWVPGIDVLGDGGGLLLSLPGLLSSLRSTITSLLQYGTAFAERVLPVVCAYEYLCTHRLAGASNGGSEEAVTAVIDARLLRIQAQCLVGDIEGAVDSLIELVRGQGLPLTSLPSMAVPSPAAGRHESKASNAEASSALPSATALPRFYNRFPPWHPLNRAALSWLATFNPLSDPRMPLLCVQNNSSATAEGAGSTSFYANLLRKALGGPLLLSRIHLARGHICRKIAAACRNASATANASAALQTPLTTPGQGGLLTSAMRKAAASTFALPSDAAASTVSPSHLQELAELSRGLQLEQLCWPLPVSSLPSSIQQQIATLSASAGAAGGAPGTAATAGAVPASAAAPAKSAAPATAASKAPASAVPQSAGLAGDAAAPGTARGSGKVGGSPAAIFEALGPISVLISLSEPSSSSLPSLLDVDASWRPALLQGARIAVCAAIRTVDPEGEFLSEPAAALTSVVFPSSSSSSSPQPSLLVPGSKAMAAIAASATAAAAATGVPFGAGDAAAGAAAPASAAASAPATAKTATAAPTAKGGAPPATAAGAATAGGALAPVPEQEEASTSASSSSSGGHGIPPPLHQAVRTFLADSFFELGEVHGENNDAKGMLLCATESMTQLRLAGLPLPVASAPQHAGGAAATSSPGAEGGGEEAGATPTMATATATATGTASAASLVPRLNLQQGSTSSLALAGGIITGAPGGVLPPHAYSAASLSPLSLLFTASPSLSDSFSAGSDGQGLSAAAGGGAFCSSTTGWLNLRFVAASCLLRLGNPAEACALIRLTLMESDASGEELIKKRLFVLHAACLRAAGDSEAALDALARVIVPSLASIRSDTFLMASSMASALSPGNELVSASASLIDDPSTVAEALLADASIKFELEAAAAEEQGGAEEDKARSSRQHYVELEAKLWEHPALKSFIKKTLPPALHALLIAGGVGSGGETDVSSSSPSAPVVRPTAGSSIDTSVVVPARIRCIRSLAVAEALLRQRCIAATGSDVGRIDQESDRLLHPLCLMPLDELQLQEGSSDGSGVVAKSLMITSTQDGSGGAASKEQPLALSWPGVDAPAFSNRSGVSATLYSDPSLALGLAKARQMMSSSLLQATATTTAAAAATATADAAGGDAASSGSSPSSPVLTAACIVLARFACRKASQSLGLLSSYAQASCSPLDAAAALICYGRALTRFCTLEAGQTNAQAQVNRYLPYLCASELALQVAVELCSSVALAQPSSAAALVGKLSLQLRFDALSSLSQLYFSHSSLLLLNTSAAAAAAATAGQVAMKLAATLRLAGEAALNLSRFRDSNGLQDAGGLRQTLETDETSKGPLGSAAALLAKAQGAGAGGAPGSASAAGSVPATASAAPTGKASAKPDPKAAAAAAAPAPAAGSTAGSSGGASSDEHGLIPQHLSALVASSSLPSASSSVSTVSLWHGLIIPLEGQYSRLLSPDGLMGAPVAPASSSSSSSMPTALIFPSLVASMRATQASEAAAVAMMLAACRLGDANQPTYHPLVQQQQPAAAAAPGSASASGSAVPTARSASASISGELPSSSSSSSGRASSILPADAAAALIPFDVAALALAASSYSLVSSPASMSSQLLAALANSDASLSSSAPFSTFGGSSTSSGSSLVAIYALSQEAALQSQQALWCIAGCGAPTAANLYSAALVGASGSGSPGTAATPATAAPGTAAAPPATARTAAGGAAVPASAGLAGQAAPGAGAGAGAPSKALWNRRFGPGAGISIAGSEDSVAAPPAAAAAFPTLRKALHLLALAARASGVTASSSSSSRSGFSSLVIHLGASPSSSSSSSSLVRMFASVCASLRVEEEDEPSPALSLPSVLGALYPPPGPHNSSSLTSPLRKQKQGSSKSHASKKSGGAAGTSSNPFAAATSTTTLRLLLGSSVASAEAAAATAATSADAAAAPAASASAPAPTITILTLKLPSSSLSSAVDTACGIASSVITKTIDSLGSNNNSAPTGSSTSSGSGGGGGGGEYGKSAKAISGALESSWPESLALGPGSGVPANAAAPAPDAAAAPAAPAAAKGGKPDPKAAAAAPVPGADASATAAGGAGPLGSTLASLPVLLQRPAVQADFAFGRAISVLANTLLHGHGHGQADASSSSSVSSVAPALASFLALAGEYESEAGALAASGGGAADAAGAAAAAAAPAAKGGKPDPKAAAAAAATVPATPAHPATALLSGAEHPRGRPVSIFEAAAAGITSSSKQPLLGQQINLSAITALAGTATATTALSPALAVAEKAAALRAKAANPAAASAGAASAAAPASGGGTGVTITLKSSLAFSGGLVDSLLSLLRWPGGASASPAAMETLKLLLLAQQQQHR